VAVVAAADVVADSAAVVVGGDSAELEGAGAGSSPIADSVVVVGSVLDDPSLPPHPARTAATVTATAAAAGGGRLMASAP